MSSTQIDRSPALSRSATGVVVTWLWAIAGPLLLAVAVVSIGRVDRQAAIQWWHRNQYVQAYVEAVFVGLLPLGMTWWRGGALRDYGVQRLRILASVSLSLGFAAVFWVYAYWTSRVWFGHSVLPFVGFPWSIWYAVIGIVANGPLEVFFVFWLIRHTDQLFADGDRRLSKGLLLTVALVGLCHVVSTQSLTNALTVAGTFLVLGLIYKHTGNSVGPMLGWTLMNGMTWAYLGLVVR